MTTRIQGVVGVCLFLFMAISAANAQPVLINYNGWSNPNGLFNPSAQLFNGTGQVDNGSFTTLTSTGNLMVQLKLDFSAIDDGNAGADNLSYQFDLRQLFTLNQRARVDVPLFADGVMNFAPIAGNQAFSNVTITATVNTAGGAATGVSASQTYAATAQGTGNLTVTDQFSFNSGVLNAGDYRLDLTFTVTADANSALSNDNSTLDVDFLNGSALRGTRTYVAAQPENNGDSRAAIGAPAARAMFGVSGNGTGGNPIRVAVLELGAVYQNNDALSGAGKVTVINPAAGNFNSEHALAVGGIIAAENANNANAGIAPDAQLVSVPISGYANFGDALTAAYGAAANVNVVNMSAGFVDMPNQEVGTLNTQINASPNITFVMAAGNNEPKAGNSISGPGMAENAIVVGALDETFTRRATFSSFSHGISPIKPDLVAPGTFINTTVARDINNDGMNNDFNRTFLGDDAHNLGGGTVGAITGTSFASPMVAGTAALMHDYRVDNPAEFDARSADIRVIKAVLLNSADTSVKQLDNSNWSQDTVITAGVLQVQRSLDLELGAGMLDVPAALSLYAAGEVKASDNNTQQQSIIDATNREQFWDLESIGSAVIGFGPARVDYILGDIAGVRVKVTLTWNATDPGVVADLELRIYREGDSDLNELGFDLLEPNNDLLLAETINTAANANAQQNVKLIEFTLPTIGALNINDGFYIEVINNSLFAVDFGIAVIIPEPTSVVMIVFAVGTLCARRRM